MAHPREAYVLECKRVIKDFRRKDQKEEMRVDAIYVSQGHLFSGCFCL